MDREDRPTRTEQGVKRVRAYLDGQLVVDTDRPRLVWEVPYYPAYHPHPTCTRPG